MFKWQTAVAIIRDQEGQVLLVHQNYKSYFYGLPGGVIEAGETPMQSVVREVKEETGLDITSCHLVSIIPLIYPGGDEYLALIFSVDNFIGSPSVQDPNEISSIDWCFPDALPEPLTPSAEASLVKINSI